MSKQHDADADEQAAEVYRRLVSETDLPERGLMVSESENAVAVVHAAPDVSGVVAALRDLGYGSIGAAGGGEFPSEYRIKEAP